MNNIIRLVTSQDQATLVRFFENNNIPAVTRKFSPFPLNAETAQRIACLPHQDRYYVTYIEEQIVGMVMLRGWDEGFEIPSFGILVDREFQGQGIGLCLTKYVLEEAKILGCKSVRLSVYASNVVAIRLYKFMGFHEVSRQSIMVLEEADVRITMKKDLGN